jgi:hypothetical protein
MIKLTKNSILKDEIEKKNSKVPKEKNTKGQIKKVVGMSLNSVQ